MSEFTDRIRDSIALSNLIVSINLAEELVNKKWDDGEINYFIRRAGTVCRNIKSRLTVVDRNLVPGNTVDQLQGPSREVLRILQELNGSEASVSRNAESDNQQIDGLLSTASALPVLPIRTTPEILQRAAEQYESDASAASKAFVAEVERLRSEMRAMEEQIQKTSSEQTDVVNELRESIKQRVDAVNETFGSLEARTNGAVEKLVQDVTSIQEEFSRSQNKRKEEFDKALGEQENVFEQQTKEKVEALKRYENQAREILEEVAGAKSAEQYAQQRDAQKLAADRWRRNGLIAVVMLAVAAIVVFSFTIIGDPEFAVSWVIARSVLFAPILLFATYALRQAGQHRRREEEMSRVSNELTLLWPFVNQLPDEDRKAIMLQITPLYFKEEYRRKSLGVVVNKEPVSPT